MECGLCRSQMRDDATVCGSCGAWIGEDDEWHRAGESWFSAWRNTRRGRRTLWALTIAVGVILGLYVGISATEDSERNAEEKVECVLAGRDDC